MGRGVAGAICENDLTGAAATESGKIAGTGVDNFMLPDQTGMGHELFYYKNAPAVVIVSGALGDDATKKAAAELAKLKVQYEAKGVHFVMLTSSLEDSRDELPHEAAHPGGPHPADPSLMHICSLQQTSRVQHSIAES